MRYYLAVAAALALQAPAAHAQNIVALVGDDIIARVDTKTGKTTGLTKIEGIGPVLGFDVRPADGQLYALASDGTIAIVDPVTGKATPKSKLELVAAEGVRVTVDFNPVADRMRIISEDGTNLRANVDDGKVTRDQTLRFMDGSPQAGATPTVIAGAYINSVKGAKETTLYDLDAGTDGLFRQAPPNDGILSLVGMTGLDIETVGFDIWADASGTNTAMIVAKGSLYTLDLETGKAGGGRPISGLPGGVRDIAVLPAPVANQAAAAPMMNGTLTAVQPQTQQTAGYLPAQAMGAMQPKPMQQKAAMSMGGDMKKMSGQPAMKVSKRGPSCDK